MKRLICLLLAAFLITALIPTSTALAASGSDYTKRVHLAEKLDELFALYPNGSYFTTDGQSHENSCSDNSCDYCQVKNVHSGTNNDKREIILNGNKTTVKEYMHTLAMPTKSQGSDYYQGYTCFGFGKFVSYFLFGQVPYNNFGTTKNPFVQTAYSKLVSSSDTDKLIDLLDKAQVGDLLQTQRHTMIYLGHDASQLTVYEDNFTDKHQVSIRKIPYKQFIKTYTFCAVVHYSKYDDLYPLCMTHTWGTDGKCTVCGEKYVWTVDNLSENQYYKAHGKTTIYAEPFFGAEKKNVLYSGDVRRVSSCVLADGAVDTPFYQLAEGGFVLTSNMQYSWREETVSHGVYIMKTVRDNVVIQTQPFAYVEKKCIVKKNTILEIIAVATNADGEKWLCLGGKYAGGYVEINALQFVQTITNSPTPNTDPPQTSLTPALTPTLTPKPDAAPVKITGVGRDNADYKPRYCLEEIREKLGQESSKWMPPFAVDENMVAGIIKSCFIQKGQRYIEVDYAYWNWDSSDGMMLQYANKSKSTFILPLASNCCISMLWPDRNDDLEWDWDESSKIAQSAFFKLSDWDTLSSCYDQVTDPGTTWSQPTYFFIKVDNSDKVTCIWQDIYYYTCN